MTTFAWLKLSRRSCLFIGASAIACFTNASAALAQGPQTGGGTAVQAAAADDDESNPDIVVTATRRETTLQDTPISITALTGDQLEKAGIEDTEDLQFRTPGLVFSMNAALGQPYIRGIGTEILSIGADSSVAMHLDGVYLARPVALVQEFLDVERVEVLRGPQGTLYGRNATGGAINIISRRPTDRFELEGDIIVGNYDRLRAKAMVNLPLGDGAALRVAGIRSRSDGWIRDIQNNRDLEGTDLDSLRAQLLLEPSSNWTIILRGDFTDDDSHRNISGKVDPRMPLPQLGRGAVIPPDPRQVRVNEPTENHLKQWGMNATVEGELGAVNFQSITAMRKSDVISVIDLDQTELRYVLDVFTEESKTFSQEFQLTSAGTGPLEWLVGAFYLHEKAAQEFNISVFAPSGARSALFDPIAENKVDAYALFGQATYSVSDRLRGTFGIRYSRERKEFEVNRPNNVPAAPFRSETGVQTFTAWTPRFAVEYDVNSDVLLYASASRGFKSGGANSSSLNGPVETFRPEKVWNYEVGLKSDLFDRQLRFNLTGFYYEYKDIQVNLRDPAQGFTRVFNGAAASGKGIEAEIMVRPRGSGFQADMGLSLLDAQFDELTTANPDSPTPTLIQDFSGNRLLRAPEVSLNLGAQYSFPALGGEITARADYRYQSKIFFNQFENILVGQPGYGLLNARIGYTTDDGRWSLALFAQNITDELYRTTVIRSPSFYGSLAFFGPPRTYGLQLSFKY